MDYLREFRLEMLRQGKSRNTINSYLQTVSDYIASIEGSGESFEPSDLCKDNIERYVEQILLRSKLKPAAINAKLSALGAFGEYLLSIQGLEYNPVKSIARPKPGTRSDSTRTLDCHEWKMLRSQFYASRNCRDIAVWELLCNTGIQAGELCAITVDDIEVQDSSGTLRISQSGKRERIIPLNQVTRGAILEYLRVRPVSDSNKLILGQRGPLGREAVYRIVNRYARLAGIPDINPSVLRHSFCSWLAQTGADLATIEYLAGNQISPRGIRYAKPSQNMASLLEAMAGGLRPQGTSSHPY